MTEDQFNEAMTMFSDTLAKMDEALRDIAASLRVLKEATLVEMRTELANQEIVNRALRGQPAKNAGTKYESGHGPRRDGDTYGIVAAQPTTTTSPEPPVHADHPPGHLRSSDEC